MKRVLLIEDEPLISDLIVDCFGSMFDAEVECASDGFSGARMIAGLHFDLAVIDVGLPLISGFELAAFAANENIPVLLVSGHPGLNEKLRRFGYPYLEKPFGLKALCAEAVRAIGESQENIRRVKDSAARMWANTEALSAALAESQRLLREIKAQQIMLEMGRVPMQTS
jgi:DNA-binding response OmpR family regulator